MTKLTGYDAIEAAESTGWTESDRKRQRDLTFAFAQKIVNAKIKCGAANAKEWRLAHEAAKKRRAAQD